MLLWLFNAITTKFLDLKSFSFKNSLLQLTESYKENSCFAFAKGELPFSFLLLPWRFAGEDGLELDFLGELAVEFEPLQGPAIQ